MLKQSSGHGTADYRVPLGLAIRRGNPFSSDQKYYHILLQMCMDDELAPKVPSYGRLWDFSHYRCSDRTLPYFGQGGGYINIVSHSLNHLPITGGGDFCREKLPWEKFYLKFWDRIFPAFLRIGTDFFPDRVHPPVLWRHIHELSVSVTPLYLLQGSPPI